jgi:hypothetical protein
VFPLDNSKSIEESRNGKSQRSDKSKRSRKEILNLGLSPKSGGLDIVSDEEGGDPAIVIPEGPAISSQRAAILEIISEDEHSARPSADSVKDTVKNRPKALHDSDDKVSAGLGSHSQVSSS